jgi:dTDP-4-amino-4,6-dideoxygalactose transaminase
LIINGEVQLPEESGSQLHVYNQYVIRVRDRDDLRMHLADRGIGTEIYYPVPLHLQDCFKDLGYHQGNFPESEGAAKEVLAIPIYPELDEKAQQFIVDSISLFYGYKES